MTTPTPTTTPKPAAAKPEQRPELLSRRYGSIGIEAVAAAARYTDHRESRADRDAAATRIDLRFVESAV
jgi:hypothetical protein